MYLCLMLQFFGPHFSSKGQFPEGTNELVMFDSTSFLAFIFPQIESQVLEYLISLERYPTVEAQFLDSLSQTY